MQYKTNLFPFKFPKYALIIAETWHITLSSLLYKWILKNLLWIHSKVSERSTFSLLEKREDYEPNFTEKNLCSVSVWLTLPGGHIGWENSEETQVAVTDLWLHVWQLVHTQLHRTEIIHHNVDIAIERQINKQHSWPTL